MDSAKQARLHLYENGLKTLLVTEHPFLHLSPWVTLVNNTVSQLVTHLGRIPYWHTNCTSELSNFQGEKTTMS